eukprot:357166-Chlamydomonas_euryale.AAC.6
MHATLHRPRRLFDERNSVVRSLAARRSPRRSFLLRFRPTQVSQPVCQHKLLPVNAKVRVFTSLLPSAAPTRRHSASTSQPWPPTRALLAVDRSRTWRAALAAPSVVRQG